MRILLLLMFLLVPATASAITVDFSTVIYDLEGKPMLDGNEGDKDRVVITLGRAAAIALLTSYPDDQTVPGEKKRLRGDLGVMLYKAGVLDLSPEDLVQIREFIQKRFGPLLISRAMPLLDGKKP